MSYSNFTAVKEALLSGASIPRTPVGVAIPARIKGGEPVTRHKQEGASTTLLVLVVIGSHLNYKSKKTRLSHNTIAREALTSTSSSKRAVEMLVGSKHLVKEPSRVRGVNTYWFGPAVAAAVRRAEAAEGDPASDMPDNSGGDEVDHNLADELEIIFPPMPPSASAQTSTKLKVAIPASTATATQIANRLEELLNQPTREFAKRRQWPATCNHMLDSHTEVDLNAAITWAFEGNGKDHWGPCFRASTDPMDYLALKFENITRAMAYVVPKPMSRSDRNPPVAQKYSVDSYLAGSTI